jgi:putative MATE family efflux protein
VTETLQEDITGNPHLLGESDIKKLLLEYSLPAIVGMVIVSLYHIVDSIFIGHGIGALAISGMAITFPVMNILSAFSTLIGVGGATLTSIRLGKKEEKGAASILGHVTLLNTVNALLLAGITYCFLEPVLRAFGASDALLPYARDFMSVYLWGTPIIFVFIALNNIMRVSGYPRKAMMSSFVSVGLNVILAPLFIFVFKWGMKGTALATVLAQLLGLIWVLSHFLDKKSYIHFTKGFHRLSFKTTKSMLSIGISPFLMNLCLGLVVFFINIGLMKHGGDLAVGAYGIINRILTLFIMVVVGLTMGMQPIAGYNYGAKEIARTFEVLKYTLLWGVSVMTFGFLVSEWFPHFIVKMFTTDRELVNISARGLRIAIAMFPLAGAQIVISNFFQSIGKVKISIFLSLSRQLIFLLPLLLILPNFWGVDGVFLSLSVADFIAFVVTALTFIYQLKRMKRKLER